MFFKSTFDYIGYLSVGPFVRPHPLVWRVVFGASLLYFLSLVFALFLRLEDARKILFYLDPSLERMRYSDILDKEYAVNCSQVFCIPKIIYNFSYRSL